MQLAHASGRKPGVALAAVSAAVIAAFSVAAATAGDAGPDAAHAASAPAAAPQARSGATLSREVAAILVPPGATEEPTDVAVRVAVPAGMHLSGAWLMGPSDDVLAASVPHAAGARFEGLAAGTYTVGYQVETDVSTADGAAISAAEAAWAEPVSVAAGGTIVLAVAEAR